MQMMTAYAASVLLPLQVGPSKQLANMFAESRRLSTVAYLVSVVLTLVFAFKRQALLCLVAIVVQLGVFATICDSACLFARVVFMSLLLPLHICIRLCLPACSTFVHAC